MKCWPSRSWPAQLPPDKHTFVPNCPLRNPKYHLIQTIRPLIEVHWGRVGRGAHEHFESCRFELRIILLSYRFPIEGQHSDVKIWCYLVHTLVQNTRRKDSTRFWQHLSGAKSCAIFSLPCSAAQHEASGKHQILAASFPQRHTLKVGPW